MRWVFFSLVGANLLVFAWDMMFSGSQLSVKAASQPSPFRNLPELRLLGEVGDLEQLEQIEEEQIPTQEPTFDTTAVDKKTLCEMVGPFKEKARADEFISRLSAIDIGSLVKELELPNGPGYWVYLKPEDSRRAALRRLAELQARGIDSYVIPKGELANGISLGMFSQENLAKSRLSEMVAIGLDAQLETIERTYRETWVMLNPEEDKKMSNLTWERVLEGLDRLERRQNFCLDVASQDNFQ